MAIAPLVSGFLHWWGQELAELWPFGRGRSGRPRRAIVVLPTQDGVQVFEERDGRIVATVGDRRLAGLARETNGRSDPIVLRLPADRVFVRTLTLPTAALADAARIADLDLEQATPFRRADVMTAVMIPSAYPNGDGAVTVQREVRQLIVKRAAIADGERLLAGYGLAPDRIDAWQPASPAGIMTAYDVDFRADPMSASPPGRRGLVWALAATVLLLAAISVAILVVRLDAALAEAEVATAAARTEFAAAQAADAGRAAQMAIIGDIEAARVTEVDRLHVLATLSRLVPDGDHLISLKISGNVLEASGYARSATALVLAMERSALFARVALTNAVTYDERLDRERYTHRAEIDRKSPQPPNGGER